MVPDTTPASGDNPSVSNKSEVQESPLKKPGSSLFANRSLETKEKTPFKKVSSVVDLNIQDTSLVSLLSFGVVSLDK